MKKIYLIGVGPGGEGGVPEASRQMIQRLPLTFAFRRYLPLVGPKGREFGPKLDGNYSQLTDALKEHDAIGLVVTGDPTNFSLAKKIRTALEDVTFEILPSAGARTALFAALQESQENPYEISAHGRDMSLHRYLGLVATNEQVLLYCDSAHSPAWAQEQLVKAGLEVELAVGCDLCWPTEQVLRGPVGSLDLTSMTGHSVVLTLNPKPKGRFWPGLPDEAFTRGSLPMTKQAIRAASLCALAPEPESLCWDVGSGTGSVSVELALACPLGHVWAIEREEEGRELALTNARSFGLHNLTALLGSAPEALEDLPTPDVVFIGGSGGELEGILTHLARRGPGIKVLVTAVTLETGAQAGALMRVLGYRSLKATTLAATNWRLLKNSSLALAQNPVTLWQGITGGEE